MNKNEETLGYTEDKMVQEILKYAGSGYNMFSDFYMKYIIENIIGDVMEDVANSSDTDGFSIGDVQLAIGRVLCERLGIII